MSHIVQQGALVSMAQAQLANGGGTLKRVAGHRIARDHLLAADSDLLDTPVSRIVHDAELPPSFL